MSTEPKHINQSRETSMTDEKTEAAIRNIAFASFLENMGEQAFMALNCDALIAFRHRNNLGAEDMNLAWGELQRRYLAAAAA